MHVLYKPLSPPPTRTLILTYSVSPYPTYLHLLLWWPQWVPSDWRGELAYGEKGGWSTCLDYRSALRTVAWAGGPSCYLNEEATNDDRKQVGKRLSICEPFSMSKIAFSRPSSVIWPGRWSLQSTWSVHTCTACSTIFVLIAQPNSQPCLSQVEGQVIIFLVL